MSEEAEMENNMKRTKRSDKESDQWRLYRQITKQLRDGPYLRLIVQASAGTGKSYLLKAVCIWLLLNKASFKAAAPTGIVAANLEMEGTCVTATTCSGRPCSAVVVCYNELEDGNVEHTCSATLGWQGTGMLRTTCNLSQEP